MTAHYPIIGAHTKVLDHGFIECLDVMGDDKAIEDAARVSYTAGESEDRTHEQRRNLLRYLMRHKHTTPYEMVEFKFRVSVPMFAWRQWIRHRTANVNEISGRYQELPEICYTPEVDQVRVQSKSSKQGRGEETVEDADAMVEAFRFEQVDAFGLYRMRLKKGVAKELARINLPLSTYTTAVWKLDLHNLFHFLQLRVHPHAQHEIRVYAVAMGEMIKQHCPVAYEAFEDYRLHAVTFSRVEKEILGAHIDSSRPLHLLLEAASNDERLGKREVAEFRAKIGAMVGRDMGG
jgi:thymidylate synthase (FAD)